MHIPRQYIVNEENKRVAVQLDITTFEKIEEILEDHELAARMKEADSDDSLSLEQARAFYSATSREK